jgi:hypothetical protein
MPMKNSHYTIGNRTRDLPACSAVPQIFINKRKSQEPSPPIFLYPPATYPFSAPNTTLTNLLSNPLDICSSKGQQSHLEPNSCTCASHQRHLMHLLSLDLVTSSHHVSNNWMFCFYSLVTKVSHVVRIKPCTPIYASI